MITEIFTHGREYFREHKIACPECGFGAWEMTVWGKQSSYERIKGTPLYVFNCGQCEATFQVNTEEPS